MVIHDFAYGDVCFDGYQAPSFLSVPGAKEVGVETTTMSKGYSMAGSRLGFCAGNAEMVRALATIKGYYDYGIFAPIQIAGIVAMRHGEEAVKRQALEYQKRRDVLVEGLRRIGWEVEPPRASMFVRALPRGAARVARGSLDFAMKLIEEAEVAVSPGRGFRRGGEGYFLAPPWSKMNTACARPCGRFLAAPAAWRWRSKGMRKNPRPYCSGDASRGESNQLLRGVLDLLTRLLGLVADRLTGLLRRIDGLFRRFLGGVRGFVNALLDVVLDVRHEQSP